MERQESHARGAATGYTSTASTTPAADQLANTNGADRQREGAHAAAAAQGTDSSANPGLQPPSTAAAPPANAPATTRPKQHKHTAERPGKLHTRVPSYRGKQHHNAPPKLISRRSYHHQEDAQPTHTTSRHTHRRAHSDIKLVGDDPSANLIRNRSHQDVAKRNKSSDKLRAPGATKSRSHAGSPTGEPAQSALARRRDDEGEEDVDDDEWVDDSANASTTASPFPRTPREPPKHPRASALSPVEAGGTPSMSSADRDIAHHKEYLTSRLLRRVPSQNVPPQVSAAMASAPRSHRNSPDTTISQDSTAPATPNAVSGGEEDEGLTSRFLTRSGSTFTREGSFYTSAAPAIAGRSLDDAALRRPRSMMDLARDDTSPRRDASEGETSQRRTRRRAPPAEISRTQQKLNLQRASSAIDPQPLHPAPTMMGPAAALAGVPSSGYDGVARDPRLPRLMEKTGMEYRVVRRHQNPVLRSVARLEDVPGWDAHRTPRGVHARNSSLPPLRDGGARPATPLRTQSSRGLARGGLVGGEGLLRREGDAAVAAALRNLWEKPLDLSASQ